MNGGNHFIWWNLGLFSKSVALSQWALLGLFVLVDRSG